jgi:pyruvate,water dikinase
MFARGAVAAEAAGAALIAALQAGRWGRLRARLGRLALPRVRALLGLRESPKFAFIRIFGHLREALLADGRALVAAGVLAQPEDITFLTLAELQEAPHPSWQTRVATRRALYAQEQRRRQIPRLLFSNGHAFYDGVAPDSGADGTLPGSPVSPGVVEGVVRVIIDPTGVRLAPGEILVCPGTDPSWTPLFLAAGGLVMEVGGLMTHGSVVAREYGIPAVVGVHAATTRLQTGDRVRVDGGTGTVTILP